MNAHTISPKNTVSSPDIEQLLFNIAEHARDEDYHQLYQGLISKELFIPIVQDSSLRSISEPSQSGDTFDPNDGSTLQIRNAEGPRKEPLVPLATKATLPIVATARVGMYWLDALAMVLKNAEVDGILLQGENSWICFYKPQIENILENYGGDCT